MVLDIRNEKDDDRKDTIAYFEKYFNRYEKEALQEKLNTNYKVVKFL